MKASTTTICFGISYQTTALAARERIAAAAPALGPALANNARLQAVVGEWATLMTCHRFEVYAQVSTDVDGAALARQWLCAAAGERVVDDFAAAYQHGDEAATRHLARVAAGLESLILGEPQILGQVSAAYKRARHEEHCGPYLRLLFRTAVGAGKQARATTTISRHPTSLSAVAVARLAEGPLPLSEQTVLVVGAGEMARLAVKALRNRRVGQLLVANRRPARAATLLAGREGEALSLEELPEALRLVDAVVSATAAPGTIITTDAVLTARRAANCRPLTLVDLALPRDVDPAVAELPGVYLLDVDTIREQLDAARAARAAAVPQVEAIIETYVSRWRRERDALASRPVVQRLRARAETIRQRQVERALKHLGDADPATVAQLDHLSRALVNQLLHEPTRRLRAAAGAQDGEALATAVRDLFALDE